MQKDACVLTGKAFLDEIGVLPADYDTSLSAMGNGKGCLLNFISHAVLQSARACVSIANKSFFNDANGKRVVCFLRMSMGRNLWTVTLKIVKFLDNKVLFLERRALKRKVKVH